MRWFLQEIEEDTEAWSNLKQLSWCNIVSYLGPAQVFVWGFKRYFYYKTNRLDCRNRLCRMCFSLVPASSFLLGAISLCIMVPFGVIQSCKELFGTSSRLLFQCWKPTCCRSPRWFHATHPWERGRPDPCGRVIPHSHPDQSL